MFSGMTGVTPMENTEHFQNMLLADLEAWDKKREGKPTQFESMEAMFQHHKEHGFPRANGVVRKGTK
jgi:hypothetical protein